MSKVDNVIAERDEVLKELVNTAIHELKNAGAGRVINKDETERAQYAIGEVMDQASKLLNGNKREFGKWRDEHIIGNGQRSVDKRTLTRWAYLPKFGSLDECRKVGFTNVYKLSAKKYAELRGEVQERLKAEPDAESDVYVEMIKQHGELLKAESAEAKANDVEDLKAKLTELEEQITALKSDNDKLKDENAELRSQLDDKNGDEAKLLNEVPEAA